MKYATKKKKGRTREAVPEPVKPKPSDRFTKKAEAAFKGVPANAVAIAVVAELLAVAKKSSKKGAVEFLEAALKQVSGSGGQDDGTGTPQGPPEG